MGWFIKTEKFKINTINMSNHQKRNYINEHKTWIKKLNLSGIKIFSGYLTNEEGIPGGGGLLFLEADSYKKAKQIIINDPMITNQLVKWELQEWKIIDQSLNQFFEIIEGTQSLTS